MQGGRYFEEVEVGEEALTPARTVTEADLLTFTALAGDHAPLEFAGSEGRPAIPEILVLALSSGLGLRVPRGRLAVLAFMSLEWRFLAPVRIGDTIRNRMRIANKRELKAGGVVVENRAILNQRGEVVQEGKITLMVAKRGAA